MGSRELRKMQPLTFRNRFFSKAQLRLQLCLTWSHTSPLREGTCAFPSPTFICHFSEGFKNQKASPRILYVADSKIIPERPRRRMQARMPQVGVFPHTQGSKEGPHWMIDIPYTSLAGHSHSPIFLGLVTLLGKETQTQYPFNACRWAWTAAP